MREVLKRVLLCTVFAWVIMLPCMIIDYWLLTHKIVLPRRLKWKICQTYFVLLSDIIKYIKTSIFDIYRNDFAIIFSLNSRQLITRSYTKSSPACVCNTQTNLTHLICRDEAACASKCSVLFHSLEPKIQRFLAIFSL